MFSRLFSFISLTVAPNPRPKPNPPEPVQLKKKEIAINEAGEEIIIEHEIISPLRK